VSTRPGFVCAFIGNPEPIRFRAVDELRKFGEVQVFGTAVDRPVSRKLDVAKDFRFVLAFENDVYPGYVTEKPLEAYACGAVPLWRGLDAAKILNPHSMINALDFPSLSHFAKEVASLDADPEKLNRVASEPLVNQVPSLEALKAALCELIASAVGNDAATSS